MIIEHVAPRAPRMALVNLATGEELVAQFNPEQLEEALGAEWAKLVVPGLSHSVKQFTRTEDVTFGNIDLFYRVTDEGPAGLQLIKRARQFLYAACHPRQTESLLQGGAPRLLFVWPKLISLTVTLNKLVFKYTKFNLEGDPTAWHAVVTLEEIRDEVVTMEDILAQGTQRSAI